MTMGACTQLVFCECGVIHDSGACHPVDNRGCVLAIGHDGPHEFVDPNGRQWLWETDMQCDCEHCAACGGDYCTIYWRKTTSAPAAV